MFVGAPANPPGGEGGGTAPRYIQPVGPVLDVPPQEASIDWNIVILVGIIVFSLYYGTRKK